MDEVKVAVRQDFEEPLSLRKAPCLPNLSHEMLDLLNQAVLQSSGKDHRSVKHLATKSDVLWAKVVSPLSL